MAEISIPKITAVLTLRDKPENLIPQLEAMENQTLPVSEIILYQDRLENGVYTIKLSDEIKGRFHQVYISDKASGAEQEREFIRENAQGDYVCILDDRAMVGNRWMEMCFFHMLLKEGTYSTYNGETSESGLALINDWPTLNLDEKERDEVILKNTWFMKKSSV